MDLLYDPLASDVEKLREELNSTVNQAARVAEYGRSITPKLERVVLVSEGAGEAIAESLKYYIDYVAKKIVYETFSSATFMNTIRVNPSRIEAATTLIVLSSKSGGTQSTSAVAKFLMDKACKTVVVTTSSEVELASFDHPAFFTGKTRQAFHSTHILVASLLMGILTEREEWTLLGSFLSSLQALPEALFRAAEEGVEPGRRFATRFKEDDPLYFISSGSGALVSHAYGQCVQEERFGFVVIPVKGAQFPHSIVETVRASKQRHYILVIPEDASRPEMLDVQQFFERHPKKKQLSVEIIDAREFELAGIHPDLRKLFGPLVAEAFLKPWAPALANATGKTMNDALLYMGKIKFYSGHQAA